MIRQLTAMLAILIVTSPPCLGDEVTAAEKGKKSEVPLRCGRLKTFDNGELTFSDSDDGVRSWKIEQYAIWITIGDTTKCPKMGRGGGPAVTPWATGQWPRPTGDAVPVQKEKDLTSCAGRGSDTIYPRYQSLTDVGKVVGRLETISKKGAVWFKPRGEKEERYYDIHDIREIVIGTCE